MTLLEGLAKNQIFIDFGADIILGEDQCCLGGPVRFPTVEFQLMPTNGLTAIADRIRHEKGFRPMHAMGEYTEDTCDNMGWYDFFIGINAFSDSHLDNCISFVVVEADSEDNEEIYYIDLLDDEQETIYDCLDEQCRMYIGKSCEDLLAEAREKMKEDES